jgi:hypothetical protein
MKQFAMILLAAVTLAGGSGIASAQGHGASGGGGGHGSGGGGGWHGNGGGWHGNGGGWHGGNWHGGNWHGNGWYGSRVVVGVGFGWPYWGWGWPGYYPYYSGYYPAYPYYSDAGYGYSAPTYGQQDAPAYTEQRSFSEGQQYLYYCPDPAGYYPQVPSCANGWLRVVPPNAPGATAPAQR